MATAFEFYQHAKQGRKLLVEVNHFGLSTTIRRRSQQRDKCFSQSANPIWKTRTLTPMCAAFHFGDPQASLSLHASFGNAASKTIFAFRTQKLNQCICTRGQFNVTKQSFFFSNCISYYHRSTAACLLPFNIGFFHTRLLCINLIQRFRSSRKNICIEHGLPHQFCM